MTSVSPKWSTLQRPDASIEYCRWGDRNQPRATVVISHGASEHAERYTRLASLLVEDGDVVYALDHRGHGRTADLHGSPGIARPGGWSAMVDDIAALVDLALSAHPGAPIVFIGHSMGSLLGQGLQQLHGDRLDGVILSGTSGSLAGADDLIALLVGIEAAEGADAPSELFAGMFAGFNEPFAASVTAPTGFEWLSRDVDEVGIYDRDPWCGGPLSNGFVTDMITAMHAMWQEGAEGRIPAELPILLVAGAEDPVGDNGASVQELCRRYESMGRGPITLKLYPGARHEILNETNRGEVHADLRRWIEETVR